MAIEVVDTGDLDAALRDGQPLPSALPVLPLRDMVAYPDTLTPLAVGQERSVKLVDDILSGERQLVLVASRDAELEEPGPDDLHTVGVSGFVARMLKVPDGTVRILVQAGERVRISDYVTEEPYLVARIEPLPDEVEETPELEALTRNVQRSFSEIIEQIPYLPEELQLAVTNIEDPSALTHLIAGALRIATDEKQELLEEVDVTKRLRRLTEILARELEVIQLGSKIQSQVQSEIDKGQREYFLREQLKAIQQELGEGDEQQAEIEELRERLAAAELPEHAQKAADRELSRLERLPQAAAEYGVIRTYLEWLVDLPWAASTDDNLDIAHAREVLDADHYDLEKVKDRILEYLAVRSLNPESHGPILCFVGPPGVGKTSLGHSIARALGREFERISVGGVRDEAEIRGHRRTYIGAMPGTIVRALRDAGTSNPVFMIDEIDKMGSDFRGDPSSAMLEVLDPAQNGNFRDHYLDLGFDLSEVLFIATANTLDTIPGPLRDRMEVIQLAGYTLDEKVHIAKRYLVPRQIEENGLKRGQIKFADAALKAIADEYTREAGVRNLEREIGTVCRKIAREVAEGKVKGKTSITATRARELLGRRRFFAESKRRTKDAGVATGPCLDARGRRRAVHRGDGDARQGQADDHRAARRRDARVGTGRALLGAPQHRDRRPRAGGGLVRGSRHPRPRPRRRRAQGRAFGGRGDDNGTGLAGQRQAGVLRRRDDRRGHADRAGAAGRRPQGEVARRTARRDQAGDRAGPQRGRHRRDPAARAGRARVHLRRRDRSRARRIDRPLGLAYLYPGAGISSTATQLEVEEERTRMASSTRTDKARHAASSVGSNQYVRRLIEDEELRDSIREAYDAGRSAYGRLQKQKRPATALMDDKKVHRELREAADSLREASDRIRGREEQQGLGARQDRGARHRRRDRRDRAQRGPAQGRARPPVRRRGGVRVHLHDRAGQRRARLGPRHSIARGD